MDGANKLKQDLRSSHFALGHSNDQAVSSSAQNYKEHPTSALIKDSNTLQAVERMRKGTINLDDGSRQATTETA